MFGEFWDELASVFEGFLFPDSIDSQKQEDKIADETVDCQLVELLREEILPFPSQVPTDFIRKIVVLLNKGNLNFLYTRSFFNWVKNYHILYNLKYNHSHSKAVEEFAFLVVK